jgi:hypothetical protein
MHRLRIARAMGTVDHSNTEVNWSALSFTHSKDKKSKEKSENALIRSENGDGNLTFRFQATLCTI